MKYVVVLHVIYVVALCRGTKCGESLDPLHVLDISNVDGSKVTVEEGNADGVSYKSFVPKANKDLKRVLDGEVILWKASSEKEKCTLADLYTGAEYGLTKLHIRDGVKSRFECFKNEGEWESVEEDVFETLLEGMKNSSKDEQVEGRVVEIIEEYISFPALIDDQMEESSETLYPPGDNVKVQEVNSENSEDPQDPSPGGDNVTASEGIEDGPEDAPIQAPLNDKGVALDISSPDSSKVSVTSRTSEGVKSTLFYPEGHVSIVCIMDSGMPILAEAGTICTEAYLFSKPGFPPLLKVHTNGGGSNACTYFEKVGGGWKTIDKDDFDGKLGTMKNGMAKNVDVQNVESVPNPRIGTPSVNPQGSHSGSYPVGTPTVTSPQPKDFVDEPVVQHPTVPPTAQENLQDLIPATPTPPMAQENVHAQHVPQMAPTPSTGVSPPMATQHLAGNVLMTPEHAHPGEVNPPTQAMPMQVHPQVAMTPTQANPPATPIPQVQAMPLVPTQGHPMNTPTQHPTGTALRQDWVHSTGGTQTAQDQAIQRNFQQMPQENAHMIHPAQLGFQVAMDPQGSPLVHARGNTPMVISPPPKDFVDKPMAQHPMGAARPEQVHPPSGAGGMPEHMPPMEIPQMMQRPVQTIPPGHANHQTVPAHMETGSLAVAPTRATPQQTLPNQDTMLIGQEPGAHMNFQHMPPILTPTMQHIPQLVVPSTQAISQVPTPTMQLMTHMHALPHTEILVRGPEPTPQLENMMAPLPVIPTAPPMPTPPMDIPYTVEPKVTYNALRNEIRTIVQEGPGEMMVKPEKTKRRKLREETAPVVKTVDLAKGESTAALFYETTMNGITHKSYFPKNHTFDNVMDGDVEVWKAGSGEESTLVFTYSKLGHPTILSVYVNGKSACFEKNGTTWTRITDANFKSSYEAMKAKEDESVEASIETVDSSKESVETPVDPTNLHHSVKTLDIDDNTGHATLHGLTQETPFSFDLASPDYSNVTVSKRERNGMEQTKYSPRDGYILTEITHDQERVWHAKENERCTKALVNSKKDFALLCIDVDGSDIKKRRFRMLEGKWTEMTPQEIVFEDHSTEVESSTQPDEQSEATPGEAPLETSEVQDSTANQHNEPSSENVPSEPGVINVFNPDTTQCQYFDYTLAGNAIKLILPKDGQSITKLMNAQEEVYTLSAGEKLEYADAYLNKDKKPELVHLVLIRSNGYSSHYMELKNGNWEHCNNPTAKINGLATSTERVSDISIDISGVKDTNNCTIFEVELLGVTTKHFFPKPGYYATKVKNGENDLWTGETHSSVRSTPDDYCLSCIIYKKDGKELLEMTLVVSRSREKKYYEKNGQKWKEIKKKEDFDEKLKNVSQIPLTGKEGYTAKEILDLANLDNVDKRVRNVYGVDLTEYHPKNGCKIKSVVDSGQTLWVTTGAECKFVQLYPQGDPPIIFIGIKKGSYFHPICFEKVAGQWKTILEGDYYERLKGDSPPGSLSKVEYILGTPTKEHSAEHTLDIAKISPSRTDVETHIIDGIGLNYYSLKDGSAIKSVMDNGRVIWKASSENESCGSLGMVSEEDSNLLMLGVSIGNTLKLLYFEQNGREWKGISEQDYNRRLETMKAPSTNQVAFPDVQVRLSPRPSPGTFLDLTSPDRNIFLVRENVLQAYKCSEYEPKYSHRKKITSLMYGDLEVWKANVNDGEALEDCTVYTKDGYSSVMCFNFGDNKAKYMLQHDGTWRNINERLFYDELKRMDKNAQEDGMTTGHGPQSMVSQEHTLDISSPDPFKINADEQKINESIYRKLSAKLGVVINAVVDSGETLWTPSVCEVVGEVTLISSGATNLLSIEFTKNGRFNCKYFEKNDDKWTPIDRSIFVGKLPEGTN